MPEPQGWQPSPALIVHEVPVHQAWHTQDRLAANRPVTGPAGPLWADADAGGDDDDADADGDGDGGDGDDGGGADDVVDDADADDAADDDAAGDLTMMLMV